MFQIYVKIQNSNTVLVSRMDVFIRVGRRHQK